MRKKIAKHYRREILRRGAEIVREEWIKEGKRKKDWCFSIEVNYKGYNIFAPEINEMLAFKSAYSCVKLVDEEFVPYEDVRPIKDDGVIGEFDFETGIVTYYGNRRE